MSVKNQSILNLEGEKEKDVDLEHNVLFVNDPKRRRTENPAQDGPYEERKITYEQMNGSNDNMDMDSRAAGV